MEEKEDSGSRKKVFGTFTVVVIFGVITHYFFKDGVSDLIAVLVLVSIAIIYNLYWKQPKEKE